MADEVTDQEGVEAEASAPAQTDAQAEAVVADKMADIFGQNAGTEQADEHEQEGITSPDEPDGVEAEAVADPAAKPDETTVEFDNATVEELKAAEKEAAAAGDYERATELRNLAKEKSAASAPASGGKAKTFDPTLKQIAKELGGWSESDVEEFVASNPTLARITFQKIAESYNNVSLQYAQAARNGVPQLAHQPQQQQNATTQKQTATLESLYNDLTNFQEVAGSEMVERFIKPLKSEVIEPLREVLGFVAERKAEAIRDEVTKGFAAISKGGFEKVYGDPADLTEAQRSNRQKVAEMADTIHVGARNRQVPMSYTEAIRRSHLIVSAGRMEQAARNDIRKQIKQRSTQIISRPSSRINQVPAKGDRAAASAVESFWDSRD